MGPMKDKLLRAQDRAHPTMMGMNLSPRVTGADEYLERPADLDCDFTFTMPRALWNTLSSPGDPKLERIKWANEMNKLIERSGHNRYCVFKFTYNRKSSPRSRKKNCPLLTAKALCVFNDCKCITITMRIPKTKNCCEDLIVHVESEGIFCHRRNEKHRRHIRTEERREFYNKLERKAPSVVTRKSIAEKCGKDEDALKYGNYNHCPSLITSQKMSSEKNLQRYMHKEMWDDLVLTSEDKINAKANFEVVSSYSMKDFWVIWETEKQLSFLENFKHKFPVTLHVDATGSIAGAIPWSDGVSYLYSLVMRGREKQPPIPLSQFLTDRHNSNTISFWLGKWLSRRKERTTSLAHVDIVVCDFSFAILHALFEKFCGMDIILYLERSFDCIDDIKPVRTVIALCHAHVMHRVSVKVYKLRPGKSEAAKESRGLALFSFSYLSRLSDFEEAKNVVRLMDMVFTPEFKDVKVDRAYEQLLSLLAGQEDLEIDESEIDDPDESEEERQEDEIEEKQCATLYSQSKWYHEFIGAMKSGEQVTGSEKNDKHIPDFMKTFLAKRYLPYWVLWSRYHLYMFPACCYNIRIFGHRIRYGYKVECCKMKALDC